MGTGRFAAAHVVALVVALASMLFWDVSISGDFTIPGRAWPVAPGLWQVNCICHISMFTVPLFIQSLLSMLMVKALWRMVSVLVNNFVILSHSCADSLSVQLQQHACAAQQLSEKGDLNDCKTHGQHHKITRQLNLLTLAIAMERCAKRCS